MSPGEMVAALEALEAELAQRPEIGALAAIGVGLVRDVIRSGAPDPVAAVEGLRATLRALWAEEIRSKFSDDE